MTNTLVEELVAITGTLALGFALGVQFAGRYITGQMGVRLAGTPAWVDTLQLASWAGLGVFGASALVALALDWRRQGGAAGGVADD